VLIRAAVQIIRSTLTAELTFGETARRERVIERLEKLC
jgi:hypothetical protein